MLNNYLGSGGQNGGLNSLYQICGPALEPTALEAAVLAAPLHLRCPDLQRRVA